MTDHWDGTHPEDVLAGQADQVVAEWRVLVEETVGSGRDRQVWKLTRVIPCEDRVEARRRAFELAEEHVTMHPMSPQGRRIYQIGTDNWVVEVPGMTADFHFRVAAARFVGGFDKNGERLLS